MQSHQQPWLQLSTSPVESWVVFGDSLSSSTHPNLPSQMVGLITRFPGHPRATPVFLPAHQLPSEEKIFTFPDSEREGTFLFFSLLSTPFAANGSQGRMDTAAREKPPPYTQCPRSPWSNRVSAGSVFLYNRRSRKGGKDRCQDSLMHWHPCSPPATLLGRSGGNLILLPPRSDFPALLC